MSNNELNYGGYVGGFFFNPIRRDISMIKGDTMSFGFQVQGLEGKIPRVSSSSAKRLLRTRARFSKSLSQTISTSARMMRRRIL